MPGAERGPHIYSMAPLANLAPLCISLLFVCMLVLLCCVVLCCVVLLCICMCSSCLSNEVTNPPAPKALQFGLGVAHAGSLMIPVEDCGGCQNELRKLCTSVHVCMYVCMHASSSLPSGIQYAWPRTLAASFHHATFQMM